MKRWLTFNWLRWNRSTLVLVLAGMFHSAYAGVLSIALPWGVMDLGGGPAEVGWMATRALGYAIACLLVASLLGRFVDRVGVKRVVLPGAILSAVFVVAMPFVHSFWLLYALAFASSIANGFFWPPMMSWVSATSEGHNLGRRLSLLNVMWSLGLVIGPLIGGFVREHAGKAETFWAASACLFAAAIIAASARGVHAARPRPAVTTAEPAGQARLWSFRWMSKIALLTTFMLSGAIGYPLSTLIKSAGFTESFNGQVVAGMNVVMMLCFMVMSRFGQWHFRGGLLWGMQLLSGLAVAAIAVAYQAWMLAGCVLIAATGIAFAYNSALFYGVSSSKSRHRSAAVNELVGYVAISAGSAIAGVLGEIMPLRTAYPVIATVLVASLTAQILLYTAARRRKTNPAI